MEFMIHEAQSDQSIHIEQIDHGTFASISATSLLLKIGAFGPALKAGRPVTGSVTIFIRCGRFLRGVSTIRPSSIFASRGSPGRISSRRRSGPGRTTCPLVDTLVCMVRRSYLSERSFANQTVARQRKWDRGTRCRRSLREQCSLGRSFGFNRPRALRVIVLHLVDPRAHRKAAHHARIVWPRHRGHRSHVSQSWIEPEVVIIFAENYWHAVVDGRCHSVWRARKTRAETGSRPARS